MSSFPRGLQIAFVIASKGLSTSLCHKRLPWLSGKESACQSGRFRFDPWSWKIPRSRRQQPPPIFLSGKSLGERSLAGYSPHRVAKSQTQQLSMHTYRNYNNAIVQCKCWRPFPKHDRTVKDTSQSTNLCWVDPVHQ